MGKEQISGSEILLRMLLHEGVECVFGYPGGAVLYIYDAMHGNGQFRHVLTRHEQGAIHAADGYARSTGKTGVCLATSGPGAANLLTGIATAHMDSIPLVVITGNVATDLIGTDAFQEADIVGMAQPVTKHSYFVRRVEDLAGTLREAFHLAGTGRKGPVLVDIPKDVSAAYTSFEVPSGDDAPVRVRGYDPKPAADPEAVRMLAVELRRAQRPVLLAGGGIIHAEAGEALGRLARGMGLPVTTTLLGLGGYPSDDPLWLGMPGMHGTYAANRALTECDLLISAGARFDDRVTARLDGFAPHAKVAHIDIDAAEIGKLVPTVLPVRGDAREVLEALAAVLEAEPEGLQSGGRYEPWVRRLAGLKRDFPLRYRQEEGPMKPQAVIELLARLSGDEAIFTTDVGQHQMWTAQFGRYNRPRSLITSGGLGTMGFGFPSAIGAQIGNPGRTVVSVNGDGGMQMCAQELAVCAIYRIPVKIAVMNNRTLGMIRQWQELIYEGRHSHIDLSGSPDFVKLAEAYGVKGLRADSLDEAERAWQEALETPGPVLVDFVVDREELVYPMVPQGSALPDMILGGE
ncbi:biosynthetic-type acetolactate synthase large subunit [Gorillibacterium sp. sgz5001074]|uniref:biosynthetic-type acetolactate synthase large subunit n=1 Tax=Gorillibacterium sp. sgz5001074 TaxID=3446695 RepID=UPI003F663FD1